MSEFIKLNIEYETELLKRLRAKHGTFNKEYRKKLKQINDLKKWI